MASENVALRMEDDRRAASEWAVALVNFGVHGPENRRIRLTMVSNRT